MKLQRMLALDTTFSLNDVSWSYLRHELPILGFEAQKQITRDIKETGKKGA